MRDLQQKVHRFNEARDWLRYHDRKSLVLAMCEELGELARLVAWDQESDIDDVASELADLLIYALSFANCAGIDAEAVVSSKLAVNASRFPI
jgi:dCTP diphosphatase